MSEPKTYYLNGVTYIPDKLQTEIWKGRYKDDYYDYDTYPPDVFLDKLVEAAKEEGRSEVRNAINKALGNK